MLDYYTFLCDTRTTQTFLRCTGSFEEQVTCVVVLLSMKSRTEFRWGLVGE
jgi:hypothetical protein